MDQLTVKDLSTRFDREASVIRRWLERGLIRAEKFGNSWAIEPAAVAEAEEAGRVPPKVGRPWSKREE